MCEVWESNNSGIKTVLVKIVDDKHGIDVGKQLLNCWLPKSFRTTELFRVQE